MSSKLKDSDFLWVCQSCGKRIEDIRFISFRGFCYECIGLRVISKETGKTGQEKEKAILHKKVYVDRISRKFLRKIGKSIEEV